VPKDRFERIKLNGLISGVKPNRCHGCVAGSKDQQVTRTRTRQQNTRQQNKPLTCVGLTLGSIIRFDRRCSIHTVSRNTRFLPKNRLAWPHHRRGLASDGVRYADAWSTVGRRFRSVAKLRLEWYEGGCLIAAAALKTPTRNGSNAQGVNLTF